MHRFFLPDANLALEAAVDLAPLHHQLSRVLRARPGDRIVLLDGRGHEFGVEIVALDRKGGQGRVRSQQRVEGEPGISLTLWQCALKTDKFEWVLQKGTELGVRRFVPVISERTIVRPAANLQKRYDRWHTIVREAAEQSGRGRLPELLPPHTWAEAIVAADGLRTMPWERHEAISSDQNPFEVLRSAQSARPPVHLLIGPEGGITDAEAAAAFQAGWRPISLGKRILRAETAALTAIVLCMGAAGELQ